MSNRFTRLATWILFNLLLWGCANDNTGAALLTLVSERDSLRTANEQKQERIDLINSMISTINASLDSIAELERWIFIDPVSEIQVSRENALKNLSRYEQVLRHQQETISRLRNNMGDSSAVGNMDGMLQVLQRQLQAKDEQIAALKSELARKNVDISRLRKQVESQITQIDEQSRTITRLDKTTKAQGEALVRQDEYLNSAYVIVGSKKDLERKGIIRKKRLIPESALNPEKFAKVDIRKYREVTFSAKKPKILTDMPQHTYSMTTDGNGNFTLRITSPEEFWKISTYLVIQTD